MHFAGAGRRFAIAACALGVLLAPALRAQTSAASGDKAQPSFDYTVKAGDTCRVLADRFWPGNAKALDALHAMNPQLGKLPHNLKPGSHLRLLEPQPDAHLTFLRPDVNKRAEREPDWERATRGDGLYRLDQVNTLRGAGAEITFRDLSAVQLDENALIVIYGDAEKKKSAKSGEVELIAGDASISLSALRGEKPLQVKTPAADVALHGETSRISVDDQNMSRVSVYKGHAKVAARGKQVAVSSGFGTRVEEGKAPEQPTALPSAPEWAESVPAASFGINSSAPVRLTFNKVPHAVRYRLQIASDAAFNDRVLDQTIEVNPAANGGSNSSLASQRLIILQSEKQVVASGALASDQGKMREGRFFARVWAADGKGLDGPPSLSRPMVLIAILETGGSPMHDGSVFGSIHGAPGAIDLTISAPEGLALSLDGVERFPAGQRTSFHLDQPGKHALVAKSTSAGAVVDTSTIAIELEPPPPPPPAPLPPPPLPPPPPPPPPAPIPEVGQTRGPLGSANVVAGGTALPSGFVESGFSAILRAQPELASPQGRKSVVLGAIDLEAGNGGAAIFASGTIQQSAAASGGTIAFPSFGVRGRVLGEEDLALSLGGDVSINVNGAADSLEVSRARLWLSGALRSGDWSLSTTQAIAPASFGTGYEGSITAGYLLSPTLVLQAEFDADAAGLCETSNCAAFAAAAGVRKRWGALEAGAALRSGIGFEGRSFWGQPAAIITIGIHLGGHVEEGH